MRQSEKSSDNCKQIAAVNRADSVFHHRISDTYDAHTGNLSEPSMKAFVIKEYVHTYKIQIMWDASEPS